MNKKEATFTNPDANGANGGQKVDNPSDIMLTQVGGDLHRFDKSALTTLPERPRQKTADDYAA